MSHAYKKAKNICINVYDNKMAVDDFYYDKNCGEYVVNTLDINGLRSKIVYFPKNNTLTDYYYNDFTSVIKNIKLGEIRKKLKSVQIDNNVGIELKTARKNIIDLYKEVNEDININIVLFDSFGEKKFSAYVVEIAKAVADVKYDEITIICPHGKKILKFNSKKEAISNNILDIAARVTQVSLFQFG
ncbi:MAG: hypothetical protein RR057_02090 [Clostridia bacterium]